MEFPGQGFFRNVSIEDYAADPCPDPSFDSRIALVLRDRSPRHARYEHPRFNKDKVTDYKRKMDIGTAFHSIALEGVEIHEALPYEDYRSNDAKFARDMAREAGLIPLLYKDMDTLRAMVDAFAEQGGYDLLEAGGRAEISGFFERDGTWYKTRPDWLYLRKNGRAKIVSLKTSGMAANYENIERVIFRDGWDLQLGLGALAVETIEEQDTEAAWLVIEQDPPYGLAYYPFAAAHLYYAKEYAAFLGRAWGHHLRTNTWPGYTPQPGARTMAYKQWDATTLRLRLGIDERKEA